MKKNIIAAMLCILVDNITSLSQQKFRHNDEITPQNYHYLQFLG